MKKLLLSLAVIATLFTACNDDDDKSNGNDGNNGIEGNLLKGNVTEDLELDPAVDYVLDGTLNVKEGATFTIPAGTTIKAKKGFYSYILIERGAKIMAEGTADEPITITSQEANPKAADWGGLIINGYAPISGVTTGTENGTEVESDIKYGGTDTHDNSGVVTYLKLMYTGARSNADVEHNGLTLNAVGDGTTIENVYIPHGADDGIEFFGGSVNVTNLLVVNSDDDMFDFTEGYTGTLKNAYGIWTEGFTSTEADPRGIEADGNMDGRGPDHVGQSDFVIENVTIVNNSGTPAHGQDLDNVGMLDAINIRRGAKANIINCVVKNGDYVNLIQVADGRMAGSDETVISYKVDGAEYETEISNIQNEGEEDEFVVNITATDDSGNTGCSSEIFGWTGFTEWN